MDEQTKANLLEQIEELVVKVDENKAKWLLEKQRLQDSHYNKEFIKNAKKGFINADNIRQIALLRRKLRYDREKSKIYWQKNKEKLSENRRARNRAKKEAKALPKPSAVEEKPYCLNPQLTNAPGYVMITTGPDYFFGISSPGYI
jgi:hypothetical protein